jgi:hypothetical protein
MLRLRRAMIQLAFVAFRSLGWVAMESDLVAASWLWSVGSNESFASRHGVD